MNNIRQLPARQAGGPDERKNPHQTKHRSYDKGLIDELNIQDGDTITVNLETGTIRNQRSGKSGAVQSFSQVQMDIYKRGGLLNK